MSLGELTLVDIASVQFSAIGRIRLRPMKSPESAIL